MKKKIRYTVLMYKPSILANETINAGILLNDEQTGYSEFYPTTNRERLMNFDTTLTLDSISLVLDSIHEEVRYEADNNPQGFQLERFIKYYINAFHFGKIENIYVNNDKDALPLLKKQYLVFDTYDEM